MTAGPPSVTTMAERAGLGTYTLPERVDPLRLDLAAEFLAAPIGRHSTELALLLGRMRSSLRHGPLLVVEASGDGRWTVLEAPSRRTGGTLVPLTTLPDRAAAERFAFRRRWKLHTGDELTLPDDDASVAPPVTAPPAPTRILGYAEPLSAPPGGVVRCHVSAPGAVRVQVVRLTPGLDRSAPDWPQATAVGIDPVEVLAGPQPVSPGSYGVVDLPAGGVRPAEGLTLQVTVALPADPPARQVILALGDPWDGGGVALWADPGPTFGVTVGTGATITEVSVPVPLHPWAWATLTATADPGAGLRIRILPLPLAVESDRSPSSEVGPEVERSVPLAGGALPVPPQLVIGGVGRATGVCSPHDVTQHFGGRVEQISLVGRGGLEPEDARLLATPGAPPLPVGLAARLAGWWDLAVGTSGWDIIDAGPASAHGHWYNLPRRAVTGSRWDGRADDWRAAPTQFAAVHLLTDALEDCDWPAVTAPTLPDDLPSGFYAFAVEHEDDRQLVPFFVSPSPDGPRNVVALLVPTATYSAYANSRFWWEDPIQEAVSDRLVAIGTGDRILIEQPELGLSHYDVHSDGTDVCHVSTRRPNLFLRADNVHDEGYTSDLDLLAWLDRSGYDHDVFTDADLHHHPDLLDAVTVLLTGTHPEYVSAVEFDAIDSFIDRGGRVMYLGGNGFHSRIDFPPERPWIVENRRIEHWSGHWPTKSAEQRLATDGGFGGYLARGGRTARRLLGVDSVTMGFDESRPFIRIDDPDPRSAFVFAGVEDRVVGDHGRLGGAVVGQEWDNSAGGELPEDHVILARTEDHSIVPALFGAHRQPYAGEMTLRFTPAGGAAWAIGSMAWCAALADGIPAGDPGGNDVARITANVLDRFLDPGGWPPAG